ncbi:MULTISPECIES: patatin-like phospholipase family protein [unclassified Uliginosibacterium]|uniref:patatin-like phospholipase family protein n=1 Tax=unclassified Uliginosibacterium TaxID=2621521 RepID=UPI000C7E78AA|nr:MULTISPECIES: patatin-like phospholipase family protein [unclassified Uliginosibacterium]MDO6387877.1 patatin-like phospholipase family protein [Uliginosibacterium sp. 31-12]PLK50127.1 alpha/beta hydrolase [Uliginosibacterium sp. TH139]
MATSRRTPSPASADTARTALIISGGAPNATLVAGALVAFHELGLKFDVISTAGAGALLGLMYCAPKNGDPVSTLAGLKEMGVADPLYEAFPVNFKVFNKPGTLADLYRRALGLNPFIQKMMDWPAQTPLAQLVKDSSALMLASACPSDLNPESLGLCAHVPFAETIIDFAAVPQITPDFCVNAFNLRTRQMENFRKDKLGPPHLQAALSFPFLYPPTELDGGLYIEGAALDCLNFHELLSRHPQLEEVVVFDILGADRLLRAPKSLYDAWVMSILTPLIEIARDDLKIFEATHLGKYPQLQRPHRVPLIDDIPEAELPDVFDWSRSNLERLFDLGFESAARYARSRLAHLAS